MLVCDPGGAPQGEERRLRARGRCLVSDASGSNYTQQAGPADAGQLGAGGAPQGEERRLRLYGAAF